ncbi:MAG: transcriptional repressor LexA [Lactobacillales bacterium]|jgi:repressor LexA|nr:transcriptional repressor LexA [Lactobacillales bacterium]
MTEKATRRIDVLRFIYETLENKKYPPTVREIGEGVGLASTSTVHGHLERLEKKGLLRRDSDKPRVLEVTSLGLQKLGVQPSEIPLLGKVAAGEPILAVEEATDFFPIPPRLKREEIPLFMLTIEGESMVNIGILDGDMIVVRKQSSASNGDIVVAMTEKDETTCKRFFRENGRIRLQPENDFMEPIIADQVSILGKVVGLYRDSVG